MVCACVWVWCVHAHDGCMRGDMEGACVWEARGYGRSMCMEGAWLWRVHVYGKRVVIVGACVWRVRGSWSMNPSTLA